MGKYTVTEGQNLYDVALHLTGSIEGHRGPADLQSRTLSGRYAPQRGRALLHGRFRHQRGCGRPIPSGTNRTGRRRT